MTQVINKPALGEGIYSIPDIARILNIPSNNIRYWVNRFWGEKFSNEYSWGSGRGKAVNFLTLIELFTYSKLRMHGVSVKRILKAHEVIADLLDTSFPFATDKILTDGKNVLFHSEAQDIIQADETLQYNLKEVIAPFCKKVDFGDGNLADKFWPIGKSKSIIVDPKYQFGQPIIEGTNIQAESINNMHKAGDTIPFIASIYQISESQVSDAIEFCKQAA